MQRGNTPELTVRTLSRPVSASGRAEWVKFAAAFFNKEAEANLVFKRTAARFDAIAAAVAAARARGEPSRASATHLSATSLGHISRPHLSATSLGHIRPHTSALARPCLSAAGAPSLHVGFVTHAPATESATAEWCYPLDAAEQLPSTDQRINTYSRHVI